MTNEPRVSVAMSTHNAATYVSEQLESLVNQTRPPDELVISDDGSTDDTVDILQRFATDSPFPVRIHVYETNVGFRANLSKAISLTTGDLIFPADHDDVWYKDKIVRSVEFFDESPRVGLVYCDADVVDTDLTPKGYRTWNRIGFTPAYQQRFAAGHGFDVLLRHNFIGGPTIAFRAKYKSLALPVPQGCFPDAWTGLVISAVSETRLIGEPMFQYRQSPKQMFGMPKKSRLRKYREAKAKVDSRHFEKIVDQLRVLRDRLTEYDPSLSGSRSVTMIDSKISLCCARGRMRENLLLRYPLIARELVSGRYHRFGHGWRTAVLDLFV